MSFQPTNFVVLACLSLVVFWPAMAAEPPDAAQIAANRAYADQLFANGKYDEAANEYEIVRRLFVHVLGEAHVQTIAVHEKLAETYSISYRHDDELPVRRALLDLKRRHLGREHQETLAAMNNLAKILVYEEEMIEGEALFTKLLAIRRRISGPEAPITLQTWQDLAETLAGEEKNKAAAAEFRQLLAVRRRVLGPEHRDTVDTQFWLAASLADLKRYAEAEKEFTDNLAIRERIEDLHDPNDPDNHPKATALMYLAGVLFNEGRYEEQETRLRELIALRKLLASKSREDKGMSLFRSYDLCHLSEALLLQKKYAEAEAEYRGVLLYYDEKQNGKRHGCDREVFEVCNKLARSLKEQGKLQEALEYTHRVESSADIKVNVYKALYKEAVKLRQEIEAASAKQ